MNVADVIQLVALVGGGAAIAEIIRAWSARQKAKRQAPLEDKSMVVKHEVDLVGAARDLLESQSVILKQRDDALELANNRYEELADKFQRVLDDLENARLLAEEREQELAQTRETIAKHEDRIVALEEALRQQGVDPKTI